MNLPDFDEKIDIEAVKRHFIELLEIFSTSVDGRCAFICNIPEHYSIWSKEAVEYFGLPEERMYFAEDKWIDYIAPEDRDRFKKNIDNLFSGKTDHHEIYYRVRNKEGFYVTCVSKGRVIKENGEPKFFAGIFINYDLNDKIETVTGLYSHPVMLQMMEDFASQNKPYYLVLMGIQRFSFINSTYGYKFGNKVIRAFSDLMLYGKKEGYVFKIEGVKFAYLIECDYLSQEELIEKTDKLRNYVKDNLIINGTKVNLEICCSLIRVDNPDIDVNAIYNSAIYALEQAKEENRQSTIIVDDEYFEGNKQQLELLSKIRRSIYNNQKGFFMTYQPIVDATTEELIGAEALLRWQDEKDVVVWPSRYIGWLEQDALFYDLGKWIIKTSLIDMLPVLKKKPKFIISINLAYPQLQRPEFETDLISIINEVGFPMENIKLELTERCRVLNLDFLRNNVVFFNSMGIKSAIDDFGTGYSALSLMMELPVTQIKIDKSFVDNIKDNYAKQSLLKAVTTCAKELDKQVCIEGIESKELSDYLRDNYMVTCFQGFYYDRPLTVSAFMDKYFNN